MKSYEFGPFIAAGRIILPFVLITFPLVYSGYISKRRKILTLKYNFGGTFSSSVVG